MTLALRLLVHHAMAVSIPPERDGGCTFLARTFAAAVALLLTACGDGGSVGPDAGGPDASQAGQGGPPGDAALIVNEVAPDPADGEPDWIELLNRSASPIDLCGYFLTDLADRLDHYHPLGGVLPPEPCPARWLDPGQRLVVVADDGEMSGIDRAGFALAHADEVHVIAVDGLGIDGLLYLLPDHHGGRSLARQPDGEGLFYLVEPSPGAANPVAP